MTIDTDIELLQLQKRLKELKQEVWEKASIEEKLGLLKEEIGMLNLNAECQKAQAMQFEAMMSAIQQYNTPGQ